MASALVPLHASAAGAGGASAMIKSARIGSGGRIEFDLEIPTGDNPADWKVVCCPKRECLWREIGVDSRFPFPWDSKDMRQPTILKPVSSGRGRLHYAVKVENPLDFTTMYTLRGVSPCAATEMCDVSVAHLAKKCGDNALLERARAAYFAQGAEDVPIHGEWRLGIEKAYRMKVTGTTFVEVDIEPFRPGPETQIVAWGDNHLKLANAKDEESENIMAAFSRRGSANPPGRGAQSLEREMELLPYFDGAAILGDNVDFFSYGSYELWKRMALDVSREPLVVIGYHDYVTHTINRRPQAEMPESVTIPVCKGYTPNDIYYATKLVGGRVLMVGMDASKNANFYWDKGIHEKLAADVRRARENGWTVLLFQHEGQYLNTWAKGADGTYDREADRKLCSRHTMTGERWMDYSSYAQILADPKKAGYAQARGTKAVYEIVQHNADVIRGVFHGHVHANYASWIQAKTPDGKSRPIPQYSCCGSVFFDDGWVFKINIKST